MGPQRDVVGEWQKAAKKQGLKFGVSEHLGASFTWWQAEQRQRHQRPLAGVPYDGADPKWQDLYHWPAAPGDTGLVQHRPALAPAMVRPHQGLVDQVPARPALLRRRLAVRRSRPSMLAHYYNATRRHTAVNWKRSTV